MADFIIPDNPIYMPVRKFEVTDAAHADLFNDVTQKLINNSEFLKKKTEKTEEDIGNLELQFHRHSEDASIHISENEAELSSHISNQNIHYTKNSIVNLLYPVGSIYHSSKATDPGVLFGGTWQQIKDVVVIAAGNTFKAGDIGGSTAHTLTEGNLPSHSHTFSGSSVCTGENNVAPLATFSGSSVTSGGQSKNHAHSIPALSGTAVSAGTHTHTLGNVGGHHNIFSGSVAEFGHILWNGGTHKTSSAGAHTHTVKTTADTSGISTESHTHNIIANGTVALTNTSHAHKVTAEGTVGTSGSGLAVNHMPPYKVMYVWERISKTITNRAVGINSPA